MGAGRSALAIPKRHLLGRCAYGQATLASTGAAPVSLAMAYVAATGDTTYTPVEFAQWATDHDLTAAGVDTIGALPAASGLRLRARRRAHGRRRPDAAPRHRLERARARRHTARHLRARASVVVLDDIDQGLPHRAARPDKRKPFAKGWAFGDITGAAALAFTVHEA